jgi:hypothetical protein
MKSEEIGEAMLDCYDEAHAILKRDRESIRVNVDLLKTGKITREFFCASVGFIATTSAFEITDSLRRLGEGLQANAEAAP